MTARLVLISLVACLGLTLPSAERLARWSRGGHAGLNRDLAGWENGGAMDDRFVFVADALEVPTVPEPTVAPKPAPEVIAVNDDDAFEAAMDEWTANVPNEEAAAPAVAVTPAQSEQALEAPASAPTEPASAPTKPVVVAPAQPEQAPTPAEPVVVAPAQPETPAVFAPLTDEELAWVLEALDPAPFENAEPAVALEPATNQTPAAESQELDQVFSTIVDQMAVSFAKDVEALAAKAEAEKARAETLAATDQSDFDFECWDLAELDGNEIALLLNQQGEQFGNGVPNVPALNPTVADRTPSEGGIAHAIRLTREAVNAWTSLLHGPAIVTIER